MAEVFKATEAGETAQLFVQFIMMYQQQTLHALGRPGLPGANLSLARIFIMQLTAIRDRTKGNLTSGEESVLNSALATLEQKYLEATREA